MQFPVLSVIVFTPILAGMLILMLPAERKNETRTVALAAAINQLEAIGMPEIAHHEADLTAYLLEPPALGEKILSVGWSRMVGWSETKPAHPYPGGCYPPHRQISCRRLRYRQTILP